MAGGKGDRPDETLPPITVGRDHIGGELVQLAQFVVTVLPFDDKLQNTLVVGHVDTGGVYATLDAVWGELDRA